MARMRVHARPRTRPRLLDSRFFLDFFRQRGLKNKFFLYTIKLYGQYQNKLNLSSVNSVKFIIVLHVLIATKLVGIEVWISPPNGSTITCTTLILKVSSQLRINFDHQGKIRNCPICFFFNYNINLFDSYFNTHNRHKRQKNGAARIYLHSAIAAIYKRETSPLPIFVYPLTTLNK